ncbi:MAG: Gfo/Idh/MocA family protein [Candidatus Sulfotelmatobacter sp.]|jgi:predicted dehydrogenase
MSTPSTIRLALIGCGEHAETGHAIPLARYQSEYPDAIALVAACDIRVERAQRFCERYGFKASYDNIDEMLSREELHACIAVVPPERISETGILLLNRHIPCVVEKPLGCVLAEVEELAKKAAESGTPNMVSVNRRFMPFLKRALEWARNAGSVHYVHCTMARHARSEREFIWATAVHAVDTLRNIAGEVEAFECRTMMAGTAAWYALDLHFQSGVEGRIDVLPTAGMVEETYAISGEDFHVSVTCPFGRRRGWQAYREGALVSEEWASSDTPEDVLNGCYDETAAFIAALRDRSAPRPSIAEVVPSVRICMSIADQQIGR